MALSDIQIERILREYEEKRSLNRAEHERRLSEIYAKIPEYEELDRLIPDYSASLASALISGNGKKEELLSNLHKKIEYTAERKRELLRFYSYPEDFLDPIFECKLCSDTGYADGKRCDCFNKKIVNKLYEQSNLCNLIKLNNFGIMKDSYYKGDALVRFKRAVAMCKRLIASYDTGDFFNILFLGTVGSGKTFLSVACAKEILDKGYFVSYFSATDFFEQLGSVTFNSSNINEKKAVYDDILNCDLLVIDDLGTELVNAFVSSQLFNCINERALKSKPTIISTNLDFEEMRARYSDRVFSRLISGYKVCELSGNDIRLMKLNENS